MLTKMCLTRKQSLEKQQTKHKHHHPNYDITGWNMLSTQTD